MNSNKEDKKKEENDKIYEDVALQIRKILKEDLFDSKQEFNKEKQNEVVKILQDNFDIGYQQIGKLFMENTTMFHKDTGHMLTYYLPFFMCPLWVAYGYKAIIPNNCFPAYNIRNKYMGYWEGEKFYKAPSRIELFIRSDRLGFIIIVGVLIYIILYVIYQIYIGG